MSITEKKLEKSIYKDKIKYFMTNHDLFKLFPNCKIVKFADLSTYKSIYDLLPNNLDFVFMLTETEPDHGHWQLILRDNEQFEFFDSYGDPPSTILNFIPKYMMKLLGNDYNEDIGHILKSIQKGDKLTINKYPFQSELNNVNTCGRWVALRVALLLQKNMTNKDFIKYIKQIKSNNKKLSNDEIIVALI